ncbi:MAG: galactose mutarotase [Planctomycetes bacterium]|nr:galactose mutarotase [Planctomycetota bacterium]
MTSSAHADVTGPVAFGKTAAGEAVEIYTLKNASGMTVKLMTLGATVVELHVPDKNGKTADVNLGFDSVAGYQSEDNQYFGCTTGRVANRIGKGKFTLDGKEYQLAINNGKNHLHGGIKRSLDKVIWKAEKVKSDAGSAVRFSYTSPDGEENYPGKLDIVVTYTLTDKNELKIDYVATTDKATPVNLANHLYFNLSGGGAATVLAHELQVHADKYVPTDDELIPTGKIEPVAGTAFDFNKMTRLGARIEPLYKTGAMGYDLSYILRKRDVKTAAARLRDPASGRTLTVYTDQPALQVYTGNFLKGQKGKYGKTYTQRSAICLETGFLPDAVNHPNFPSIILRPGETYRQTCVYAFANE